MTVVAIAGAGHVGVVYAAGLAELGHRVQVVDIDRRKVSTLRRGEVWFHEPGLRELLARNLKRDRVLFTTSYATALRGAEFVFVCVPTPTTSDGSLDDSMLRGSFEAIRVAAQTNPLVVVNKSTVPVGTGTLAREVFGNSAIRVVSSPEFLAEGHAVQDFFNPNRIVLGATEREPAERVAKLFAGIRAPIVYTDTTTAEFSKLSANAFLATKISFANALARLSEAVGADVEALTEILSLDPRIGRGHLFPGLGFGGSCLPKDVAAIEHLARLHGTATDLFSAVPHVNSHQRARVIDYLVGRFGTVAGRRVAILGLAFKAGTDDVRDSPGIALASQLCDLAAEVIVFDPVARAGASLNGRKVRVARSAIGAARGADAVVLATEWPELAAVDLTQLRRVMRGNVLVDGRGLIAAAAARNQGFEYFGFGRGGTQQS